MGIEFKTNVNFARISEELERKKKLGLEHGLIQARREIIERTQQQGVDVDGAEFTAYTPAYAAFKYLKKGRGGFSRSEKKKLKQSSVIRGKFSNFGRPNLTLTGVMLQSIATGVSYSFGKGRELLGAIYFSSAREAVKALGNMRKRRFFALSDSQIGKIKQRIQEALNG